MIRDQVHQEMRDMLGVVPAFMDALPDKTLELEWELFKRVQLEPGALDNKVRELIGLAMAAVTKCKYCLFFHTEMAKLFGATHEEIEDALHYAKSSIGWSTYITGMGTDYERFQQDVLAACDHVRHQMHAHA